MSINRTTRKVITQNMYKGEAALKSFKAEYPYLMSNIKFNQIIDNHSGNSKFREILPKIKGKSVLAGFQILKMRCLCGMVENEKDNLDVLKKFIKQTNIAGCGECSRIMKEKLDALGIPSKNVRMFIEKNDGMDTHKNHAFNLIGVKEGANIDDPRTWGKNAVIVDGWATVVKRAQDGLEYFKEIFKFNPKEEVCKFEGFEQ